MQRELHDHYFKQAKRDGYRSRAAYKLIEIDERRRVMQRGDLVLDCGASPGAWLQVAAERVGPKGRVVGFDLKPIEGGFKHATIHAMQADARALDPAPLLAAAEAKHFDVVLSDLAPSTTGEAAIDHHRSVDLCRCVLDVAEQVLRPGGGLVMKVFEGEAYPDLLEETKARFEKAKGFKPKASRAVSREMYIVAHGFRPGSAGPDRAEDADTAPAAPPPRPTGWAQK